MCNWEEKGGSIMGGIETAKAFMETGKKALDIANELKNVDLKESILELREEILLLREENFLLKEKLNMKQNHNMIFKNNCYWNIKEDGIEEGPYCSVCWDDSQTAVRLTRSAVNRDFYICGKCKHEVCVHNIEDY